MNCPARIVAFSVFSAIERTHCVNGTACDGDKRNDAVSDVDEYIITRRRAPPAVRRDARRLLRCQRWKQAVGQR